jgi:hypothetical protein
MSADLLKLGSLFRPCIRSGGYERSPQNRHYSYRKTLCRMQENAPLIPFIQILENKNSV